MFVQNKSSRKDTAPDVHSTPARPPRRRGSRRGQRSRLDRRDARGQQLNRRRADPGDDGPGHHHVRRPDLQPPLGLLGAGHASPAGRPARSAGRQGYLLLSVRGGVAEWSIAPVLKTGVRASGPWVRIPPPPLHPAGPRLSWRVCAASSAAFGRLGEVNSSHVIWPSPGRSFPGERRRVRIGEVVRVDERPVSQAPIVGMTAPPRHRHG